MYDDESLVLSLGFLCTAISWHEGLVSKQGIVTDGSGRSCRKCTEPLRQSTMGNKICFAFTFIVFAYNLMIWMLSKGSRNLSGKMLLNKRQRIPG